MEDIEKVILAVGKELGIDRKVLLTARSHPANYAREILCHTVKNGYSGLVPALTKATGQTIGACYKMAHLAEEQWRQDTVFLGHLNNVRRRLGLNLLKRREQAGEEPPEEPAFTADGVPKPFRKSPLGPEYSELDEIRIKLAKERAAEYMADYGKGVKPLKAGYATVREC